MNPPHESERHPVILVHGWNSHPGVWNRLSPLLEKDGVPVWKFDFSRLGRPSIPAVASLFGTFLDTRRDESGWQGDIDIVCHSLGTCAARYYLEVMDPSSQEGLVRQLIGLGAPNTGSALADLFLDPTRGRAIRRTLGGIFVPEGSDLSEDPLVRDVCHGSRVMKEFDEAGLRRDISYRMIVTENTGQDPAFFPWLDGLTWERDDRGGFARTPCGDGIVSNRESALPGIIPDCIRSTGSGNPVPVQFCHINMPRNPVVMDRVIRYLRQAPVPHPDPEQAGDHRRGGYNGILRKR